VPRTPRGSEIARTPRGETDSQKKTLLIPNTIEEDLEDDEADEEAGTFKDLRNSAELRATQGIADKILVTKDEKGSSSSGIKKPKFQKKKRHSRSHSRSDIELQEVTRGNKNDKTDAEEEEVEDEPRKVPSFKDKASLSILPSFLPFHRRSSASDQPAANPSLSLPLISKATKGRDSGDDESRYVQ
jgi:hypothetical protein